MTIADEARDSALHFEGVKVAYRQTKDGVVISLVVHPQEVPEQLATSDLGTRYVVALVQIGDDEKPIPQAEKERSKPTATKPPAQPQPIPPAGAKRPWQDLQPQQQAGIRCGEPSFIAFLKENHQGEWHETSDAAECVRFICNVHSRVELGTNQRARMIWKQLDDEYAAWKVMERA